VVTNSPLEFGRMPGEWCDVGTGLDRHAHAIQTPGGSVGFNLFRSSCQKAYPGMNPFNYRQEKGFRLT
jgi:hypothetical protein